MKNKFGLLERDLEIIVQTIRNYPSVETALIFGSRAKGNYKNGSDVDIALKGKSIDLDTVNQISYFLNEETNMPYQFDVVSYTSIQEPALVDHIDRVGVKIYDLTISI